MERVYNFSAGPSMLPLPVLQRAQAELLDYLSLIHISEPTRRS